MSLNRPVLGRSRSARSFVIAVATTVLVVACGDDDGTGLETGPSGGTITAANGQVSLVFPAGAVANAIMVTVDPVAAPPAAAGLVPNTSFDFGPDGTMFAQPVQLTIGYDPADIPAGVMEADLRLQTVVMGSWQEVVGSSVNAAANTVAGSIMSFSEYGVVAAATPASLTGEWNGVVDNSGGLSFIIDVVDPDDGTLVASVPVDFGQFSISLNATGTKSGFDVTLDFTDPTPLSYWTYTGVLSADGQTIDGTITGSGVTPFPALSGNTLQLIRQ